MPASRVGEYAATLSWEPTKICRRCSDSMRARSWPWAILNPPDLRIRLYERLRQLGFEMPVVMSPRAYVSRHASVGEGTIVMHGAIVNAGAP